MINTNSDMRFMSNNFLETGYTSLEVSSSAPNYYKEDLVTHERSRTFKFGGSFEIKTGVNDRIHWADNFTGQTYITLRPGIYTIDGIITEVIYHKPDMHLVYEGNKFIFRENATSYWIFPQVPDRAIWETIGFTQTTTQNQVLNPVNSKWEITATLPRFHFPYESIKINFGYQAVLGFTALIGDLTKELRIPEGAEVRFRANNVDNFDTPPVDILLDWYKRGMFSFINNADDSAWQYVWITISHPEGPFHSEIGYLYVGDAASFKDRNVSTGIDIRYVDNSTASASDDGQIYSDEKTAFRSVSALEVGLASPENINFLRRIYALKQKSRPFFVSLDPTVKITESLDDLTFFCRFSEDFNARHVLGRRYGAFFKLDEAL